MSKCVKCQSQLPCTADDSCHCQGFKITERLLAYLTPIYGENCLCRTCISAYEVNFYNAFRQDLLLTASNINPHLTAYLLEGFTFKRSSPKSSLAENAAYTSLLLAVQALFFCRITNTVLANELSSLLDIFEERHYQIISDLFPELDLTLTQMFTNDAKLN